MFSKNVIPKDLLLQIINEDIKRLENAIQRSSRCIPHIKKIGLDPTSDEWVFLALNKYHGYWRLLFLKNHKEVITIEDVERDGIPLIRASLSIRIFAHSKENYNTHLHQFLHDWAIKK